MSELTGKHLQANGAANIVVANRTEQRAAELAAKFGGTYCSIQQITQHLATVDVLISSAGADEWILKRSQLEGMMSMRKGRPLFMIDIAVPRNLDPSINELPNVFLYDIDDLEGIVEGNLELRRQEAEKLEVMIDQEIEDYEGWYATLGVSPVIRALQDKAAIIHQETLESLFNKLPELSDHEQKVIRKLTKSIVNQMMHDPIKHIKEMAGARKSEEAIRTFNQIFNLQDQVKRIEQQEFKERTQSINQKVQADRSGELLLSLKG